MFQTFYMINLLENKWKQGQSGQILDFSKYIQNYIINMLVHTKQVQDKYIQNYIINMLSRIIIRM